MCGIGTVDTLHIFQIISFLSSTAQLSAEQMITAEVVEIFEYRGIFGVNGRRVNPEFESRFSNMEYKTIVFRNQEEVKEKLNYC